MSLQEPEHIAVSKSKGIDIDWKDGLHTSFTLAQLRDNCPCAHCTGAHGTEPQKTNYANPSPFQMYQPALKMLSCEAAGNYALKISWSDGHSSGIYSFDFLRRLATEGGS
ncbi:DUF971 domain-containing protein [Bryobacter aggregatus]|uniref:DUF971 domain-containing protein n=1 Tax=Bryobacter aggregatus TaxID=360054 RepID=UPI0004E1B3DF|nr:DUF971 domain-containing protein [Bryobacter aggregatus]